MQEFRLTEDHLKLLRRANVGWQDCEYGAPEIDPKRPFGNSSVALDIAEILGWEVPSRDVGGGYVETDYEHPDYPTFEERCRTVHRELETALQIVLLSSGLMAAPGLYRQTKEYDYRSWKRVED